MKTVGVRAVDGAEIHGSVAAVGVGDDSITFYANRTLFPTLSRSRQLFILAHEIGHVVLGTSDEELCDAFALGLTAGRQHRSLKEAVLAIASLPRVPAKRADALFRLAARMDRKQF